MLAGYPPFYDDDPIKIYANILACKPQYTVVFDDVVKDLLLQLLTADLTKRFGNLKNGVQDIKSHSWFDSIDWKAFLNGETIPPFVPTVKDENDTSNFDEYPDERIVFEDIIDRFGHKFDLFDD
jgi:serine/threonine protein kinase